MPTKNNLFGSLTMVVLGIVGILLSFTGLFHPFVALTGLLISVFLCFRGSMGMIEYFYDDLPQPSIIRTVCIGLCIAFLWGGTFSLIPSLDAALSSSGQTSGCEQTYDQTEETTRPTEAPVFPDIIVR